VFVKICVPGYRPEFKSCCIDYGEPSIGRRIVSQVAGTYLGWPCLLLVAAGQGTEDHTYSLVSRMILRGG
jgi:hypothetical protein